MLVPHNGSQSSKKTSWMENAMNLLWANKAVLMALAFVAGVCGSVQAQEQKVGAPPEAQNMRLVGYNDLQARSAYQPTIHHQGDRYIAYICHHSGTDAILDPVHPMTGKGAPNGTSI